MTLYVNPVTLHEANPRETTLGHLVLDLNRQAPGHKDESLESISSPLPKKPFHLHHYRIENLSSVDSTVVRTIEASPFGESICAQSHNGRSNALWGLLCFGSLLF